jgi:hypothetical protein
MDVVLASQVPHHSTQQIQMLAAVFHHHQTILPAEANG